MAEPIVIKVTLDTSERTKAANEIRAAFKSALDGIVADARQTGNQVARTLSGNFQQSQSQVDRARNAARAQQISAEQQHLFKLREIAQKAAADQQTIEARKQAQIEAIRERAAIAEEQRQKRLAARLSANDGFTGFLRRYSSTIREAGESIQQAGEGLTRLTTGIINLGQKAVQSAIDIDRQVNVLKSLTGSAEAAEKRYKQLVETALRTPGLTANLAATLDAQLRVANVTEQTINRILPAIGKLNAVSPLGDPQKFANNLVQLVTQNFERTDLKELIGQSPLAGEIIKQIFNVDNATNAKAIRESAKRLGITTTDEFFTAFAEAAKANPKLANVTESLGTQFEKLKDRVQVALRPLGLAIVNTLGPLVEKVVPIIERLSKAFADLPEGTRQAIVVILGVAAALGPVIIAVGSAIQAFGALGNIITVISGASGLGALIPGLGQIVLVIAGVVGAAVALYAAWRTNFGGIRDITLEIVGEIREFANEQLAVIVKFWQENLPLIQETVRTVLEAIRQFWQEHGEEITAIVRLAFEIIKTLVAGGLAQVLDLIRLTLQIINGDWSGAWETFQRIVERSVNATISVVSNLAKILFQILLKIINFIPNLVDNLSRKFIEVGNAIIDGIVKGIQSGAAAIFEKIKQIATGAVKAAKDALGIQSPSSIFLAIGQNIMQAFAQGVTQNGSMAQFSIQRVFSSLVDSAVQLIDGGLKKLLGRFGGFGNVLAGALGGGGIGGLGGFGTPPFNPNASGRISIPPSTNIPIPGLPRTGTGSLGGILGNLTGLFKGIGFGLPAGSQRGALAGALPLLGLGLSSGLGGSSFAGQLLGGAGGALLGIGLTAAPAGLAGGALGFLAPLFSNPITAIVGAALLPGAFLLGRAKQRRADEGASGDFLTAAINGIRSLRNQVERDQIAGEEARRVFENEVLATFIAQINTLKTKSVRESRLTNQVRDLRNLFDQEVGPAIIAQRNRQQTFSKLIPEFAFGGFVPGIDQGVDSVLSLLRPGEMVLTVRHQREIQQIAGADVFGRVGVPGAAMASVGGVPAFAFGGVSRPVSSFDGGTVVIEELSVAFVVGSDDASRLFVMGGRTKDGRRIVVNNVREAQRDREL